MNEITICEMTRELCHGFFKEFENDSDIFMDMNSFTEYQYNEKSVDSYFEKQKKLNRIVFAIMKDNYPIGEIKLKDIDENKKECTLSIHLQNDSYKGKGYGTIAEKLAIDYAFNVLEMKAINADAVLKNERSQYVLEKIGFIFTGSDEMFKYYRIER